MDVSAVAKSMTSVGSLIRMRRRQLGLTQGEVARKANLSVGFISQVERGLTMPSLSSMVAIAEALDSEPGNFLLQPAAPELNTMAAARKRYSVAQDSAAHVEYERLSSVFAGGILHSVLFHIPAGYVSETITHEGEELVFVVEGSISITVGNESLVLNKGDSAHFSSTRQHSYSNNTDRTSLVLYVGTLGLFG